MKTFEEDFLSQYGREIAQDWINAGRGRTDQRRQLSSDDDLSEGVIFGLFAALTYGWKNLFPLRAEMEIFVARHLEEVQRMGTVTRPISKIAFMSGKYDMIYKPCLVDRLDVIFWRS